MVYRNWNGERIAKDRGGATSVSYNKWSRPIEIHRVRRSPGDFMQVFRIPVLI